MKEYLNKLTDGTYKLVVLSDVLSDVIDGHDGLIEIPEGAQVYAVNNGYHYFFSSAGIGFEWSVLWRRAQQPEELPFVDDEPSLNDQYAEIEKARKEAQAWANRPVGRCRTVPIDEPKYDPEDINLATGYDLDELAKEYGYRERDMHESDLCYRESLKIFIERKPNQTTINAMNEADTLFSDAVSHPSHYASGEIECIDAIESSMTHEAFCGYLKGNVQKYMWRYENKGGLESLEKAQWYLNKLISRIG